MPRAVGPRVPIRFKLHRRRSGLADWGAARVNWGKYAVAVLGVRSGSLPISASRTRKTLIDVAWGGLMSTARTDFVGGA